MKQLWLLAVLSWPLICAFGQTTDQQAAYQQALKAYLGGQFDESRQITRQLLEQYPQQDGFALDLNLLLAKNYDALNENEAIIPLVSRIEALLSQEHTRAPWHTVWALYFRGLTQIYQGELDSGIQAYQQALELLPPAPGGPEADVIPLLHNHLGYLLMERNQPDTALFHLEKAYAIWQDNPGVNAQGNTVRILTNIGRLYKERFQPDRALHYSQQALRMARRYFGQASEAAVDAAANHALLLEQLNRFPEAEATYQSIAPYLDQVDQRIHSNILGNWGVLYRHWERYEQSLVKLRAAADLDRSLLPEKDPAYVGSLINIAGIYFRTGRIEEVLPVLAEADSIANRYGSSYHPTLIGAIGLTFSQLNRPQEALEYLQKALAFATRTPELLSADGWPNPPLERFVVASNSPHLDYLRFKTMALWNIYEQDPDPAYLDVAFDTYALLHDLLQKTFLYADIWQDNKLQTNLKFAMEGLLKTSYTLQQAGKENRLEEVYSYLQQSKGLSIRVQRQAANTRDDASPELDSLQKAVIATEQALFMAQRSPDYSLGDSLEQRIIQLNDALKAKKPSLPTGFLEVPEYAVLQAALPPESLFLETYLTEAGVYNLAITSDELRLFFGESQQAIPELIQQTRRSLANWDYIRTQPDSAKFYLARGGQALYQLLLAPVLETYPQCNQLLIAPNDILSALPYAILLPGSEPLVDQAYRNWPFLLRNYNLSYAYSASVWLEQSQRKAPNKARYLAAFAPRYEASDTSFQASANPAQDIPTRSLPYALREAKAICDLTGGDLFAGSTATKSGFWATVDRYRLLHLAMHGVVEADNPSFSRLIFTNDSSAQTAILYANELYNRQLNLDLVVLSACNTGVGESVQSEGMLSLGHAFATAGASATVITLWPVADAAGMQLISNFYTQLWSGMPKSQALQQAKVQFLEKAASDLEGHPYFWAAYQLYGADAPIAQSSPSWHSWLGFILAGGFFVGLFGYWRLNNKAVQQPAA